MDLKFSMKPYLPSIVVSIILFIFVFLPWLRVDMGTYFYTENGLNDWGYLVLIMSVIGACVSFIAPPRVRSLSIILTGVLAIVGAAVYWSRLQGAGVGYGLIIALIAALALLTVGYLDYRKINAPAKPSQPSQPPPPQP